MDQHRRPRLLVESFVASATAHPEAVAVVVGDRRVRYRDLLADVLDLAGRLREHGVGAETPVGVSAVRDSGFVVGTLAAMAAGGCYVPLDPTHPADRLAALARRADVRVGVGATSALPFLDVVLPPSTPDGPRRTDPPGVMAPDALAYQLFTSGSSGEPKIVPIEQRSVQALLDGFDTVAPPVARTVSLSVCPFSFDVSVWELFLPLTCGGTVVIAETAVGADPEALVRLIREHGITTVYLPPFSLEPVADELAADGAPLSVERILTGVEPIPQRTLQRLADLLPTAVIVNGYGPTEATICATFHVFDGADDPDRRTPIGLPVPGWEVLVVDGDLAPVPVGVVGEIVVSGAGLARGYLNDHHLTTQRFYHDPTGTRWYRTGDLGRWQHTGNLEYLGRQDHQVKFRGFRIEPGEIEATLTRHPHIRAAAVTTHTTHTGQRLIAHIETTTHTDPTTIRHWLRTHLPDYMIPTRIIPIPTLPTTPNGKIDRTALHHHTPTPITTTPTTTTPTTPLQQRLTDLWRDTLELDHIDINDNFFDLGGDSRLAMVLVSRIRQEYGRTVSGGALLARRTIAEQAALIERTLPAEQPAPAGWVVPGGPDDGTGESDAGPDGTPAGPLVAPLSYGQEGLWTWQLLHPGSRAFVLPVTLRIKGGPEPARLAAHLSRALGTHEAFTVEIGAGTGRTELRRTDQPCRVDVQEPVVAVDRVEAYLHQTFQLLAGQVVSEGGPLWRAVVARIDDGTHLVLIAAHHLLVDGASVRIIVDSLRNELAGTPTTGTPGMLAFATAQRRTAPATWHTERDHWQREFTPPPEALDLPLDRPRPVRRSESGRSVTVTLEPTVTTAVVALATRHRSSPFAVLLAALAAVAHRYSGQNDFAVSVPTAVDRSGPDLADTVGYLVNLLPIRFDVSSTTTLAELVAATTSRLSTAVANSALPFEEILAAMAGSRSDNADRLTRMVVAQDMPTGLPATVDGCVIDELPFDPGVAKYELGVFVTERSGTIQLRWEFATDVLDDATVRRLNASLGLLLTSALAAPPAPISRTDLLTDADRAFLEQVNRTASDYPADAGLIELFDEQVALRPDAPAVRGTPAVTYRELYDWSVGIAARLVAAGVQPGQPVLVLVDRSPEFLAALLGVLRAGGAYVPLDARSPAERVSVIRDSTGAIHAVVSAGMAHLVPGDTVRVDPSRTTAVTTPSGFPARGPQSSAYVMYTSGSTGQPKGVEIVDRSVVRLVRGQNFATFGPSDVFVLCSNLAFDAATLEIWGALLNGGSIAVPTDVTVADQRELAGFIARNGVTAGFFNVAVFRMMLEADPYALRGMHTILVGGEAVPGTLMAEAARFLDHRNLLNGYGPTENTTFSCCHRLLEPPAPDRSVPIGRPLANSAALVVDGDLAPVPVGVVGEIVVSGAGLARGYLNDHHLTTQRFYHDPTGTRWYRTGDLGRWQHTGNLEYLGRQDHQVKIRGFRIEPGEIEATLTRHPHIRVAAVTTHTTHTGQRLIAHIETTTHTDPATIRHWLRTLLPDYMIPARIIPIPTLPTTPNGKIDRTALQHLDHTPATRNTTPATPATPLQRRLTDLWRDTLELDHIDINDNFFDLGGDSRILAVLAARIRTEFDADLRVLDLMTHPTIASLSRRLSGGQPDDDRLRAVAEQRAKRRERKRKA
ncbi:amino acid adenylation domain-containing protein [Micromonospora peucetia]|uniref:amino acid adenylation domain-containing protein n=1 Tax=Micromonospora peucetia TaxID=47871 RepID=UPI00332121CE